jgi:hypothetical protein
VLGFQDTQAVGQAAVLVGESGRTVFQGEVPFVFNEADLRPLLENEINYVCRQPRELCTGGVDEDLDGLTDCEDPDCAGAPACANVLVYTEKCGSDNPWAAPYVTAAENLGYAVTAYDGEVEGIDAFLTALATGTWDLVIYEEYNYGTYATELDALDTYLDGGGRLIFAPYYIDDMAHPLVAGFGVTAGTVFTTGQTLNVWYDAHPVALFPNAIAASIASTFDDCSDDGYFFTTDGSGVSVLGYSASETADQSAVIVNGDGTAILMGELPWMFSEADLAALLENQISYLL